MPFVRMTRRSALLVVVCSLFLVGIGSAAAQDPRATSAQIQARNWLELTDGGDALASWKAAGKKFQDAITAERWADSLKQVRPPLGATSERTLLSTQFTKGFSGAPEGDYVLLTFRSNFANKTDSRETVTLEREGDGVWRVIGYFIR
jgi:Protein of unknown function (DUF4019)